MTQHFTESTRAKLLQDFRDSHPKAVALAHDPNLTHEQEAHHLGFLVRGFRMARPENRMRWLHRISAFVDGVAVEQMDRDLVRVAVGEDARGVGDGLGAA